jgi:hypothetical protein
MRENFLVRAFGDHIDLILEIRQPAYATADLFRSHMTSIFFPALQVLARLGCSQNLPKEELLSSPIQLTHQIYSKFSISYCSRD